MSEFSMFDWEAVEGFTEFCKRLFCQRQEDNLKYLDALNRDPFLLETKILSRADPLLLTSRGLSTLDGVLDWMVRGHLIASEETSSGTLKQNILIEGARRYKERWVEVLDLSAKEKIKEANTTDEWRGFFVQKVEGVDVLLRDRTKLYITQIKSGEKGYNNASRNGTSDALKEVRSRMTEKFPDLKIETLTLFLTGNASTKIKKTGEIYESGEIAWWFATGSRELPRWVAAKFEEFHSSGLVDRRKEKEAIERLLKTCKDRLRHLKLTTQREGCEILDVQALAQFTLGSRQNKADALEACQCPKVGEFVSISETSALHHGLPHNTNLRVVNVIFFGRDSFLELAHEEAPERKATVPLMDIEPEWLRCLKSSKH